MVHHQATERPPRKRKDDPPALFRPDPLNGELRAAPPPTLEPPFDPFGRATGRQAAERIQPHASRLREIVLNVLANAPHGLTDAEIQAKAELTGNSERPRRRELEQLGLVHDTGERRRTPTGRSAAVWALTDAGRAEIGGSR